MNIFILIVDISIFAGVSKIQGVYLSVLNKEYCIPSLVRFGKILDPIKNPVFQKCLFTIIANLRMEYQIFFSRQAIGKIVLALTLT